MEDPPSLRPVQLELVCHRHLIYLLFVVAVVNAAVAVAVVASLIAAEGVVAVALAVIVGHFASIVHQPVVAALLTRLL